MLFHSFIVYLYYFTIYLSIYLFYFGTIFDWLTPFSAMFWYVGGPHTNHHNVYIYFVHLLFLGDLYICI